MEVTAFEPGDLVVEPSIRYPHLPQEFRVVSLKEKRENEWRKDWYWPSVLHGLTKPQAALFAAAPNMLAALRAIVRCAEESRGANDVRRPEIAAAMDILARLETQS